MTHNQINYWSLQESKRHNVTTEGETQRHNVVTEQIDLGRLNETVRHNRVTEDETHRHNVVTEGETQRHNVVTEGETQRHNMRTEGQTDVDLSIRAESQAETHRHNVVSEAIAGGNLAEQRRHNAAQESLTQTDLNINASRVQAQNAYDYQKIEESKAQTNLTDAKTTYQEIQNTWADLKAMKDLALTDAQIAEVETKISNLDQQTALYQSQIRVNDYTNASRTWENINGTINSISGIFRSIKRK